ncbi:MAG: rod shape-determining protein MreC [Oscillospiraceae bacterium]|jgi:rod shape-determining protein MreC|nr:rod shape-determining protein MreC [Oscillospiraceae bacterium]
MRNFFASRGIKVTAILLTLILALLVASLIWGGSGSVLNDALRTMFSPVERLLSNGAERLKDVYAYLYEFDNITAENARLKTQLAKMDEEIREARGANEENERLKRLLELMTTEQDWEPKAIEPLISWTASSWSSSFVIAGGTSAGIQIGDSVITEEGFLVGQVIEVGTMTAKVRTIIDIDSSVGALVDRNGISGVASGDFELMERGLLKLGMLPTAPDLLNGDTIMTSGSGEVFPQGLVIGTISAYKADNSGMNWYGEIKPSADFDSLTEVFIVR